MQRSAGCCLTPATGEPVSGAQLGKGKSNLRTGACSAVVAVVVARRSVAVAGRIVARKRKRGNRTGGASQSRRANRAGVTVDPARRVQYQHLGLPIENSIHVCVLGSRL